MSGHVKIHVRKQYIHADVIVAVMLVPLKSKGYICNDRKWS